MKIAPGHTGPRDPENPIKNKAMIPRATAAARTALNHEWFKTCPFFITHQTPDHSSLLKSYPESQTTTFGNPLCQHVLNVYFLHFYLKTGLSGHDNKAGPITQTNFEDFVAH